MFEKFTDKARRVVFFARYEASQFGSPYIETEHLVLGLLREDKALTHRFLGSPGTLEAVRKEIEQHTTIREKIHTSVDLPLSNENKRVLAYAAEEAERLSHQHIGTEHLLLGLLREEKCFAAKVLRDRGVHLERVREELKGVPHELSESQERARHHSVHSQFSGDFVHALGQVQPLIGREDELERLICILCRRTRKSPVLVGEPGVGKRTIIAALAQRIADGTVPAVLAGKSILALNLPPVGDIEKDSAWLRNFQTALPTEGAIFFIDELHTPANSVSGKGSLHIEEILKPSVMRGQIQCISTATPDGYAKSVENHGWLEQYFQPVAVTPATEADAIKVLLGIKDECEKFHGVAYTEDALAYAVYYASCCIRGRALPGKAVDVIDEAAAGVGQHHRVLPQEVGELQTRIKFIVHRMEGAIANHEFEKARFYAEEDRKERENLRLLREKYKLDETVISSVTREHIENVVSRWTGATIASIRQVLANSKKPHP
jgi:ATP-dependent Clp protease ATP-binding subunit ClpC